MSLSLIGIGLGGVSDLTLRGIECIRQADVVYLEAYTAILCGTFDAIPATSGAIHQTSVQKLEELTGKAVVVADRYLVEDATELMAHSKQGRHVALLVVGDPFAATTHSDLYVRFRREHIPVHVVHNATILTAVGISGLQLYRFGATITLCFWTETWRPDSWKSALLENLARGLHTLVLLDIKVKEVSDENLARGRTHVFESPRFMTAMEGARQVLNVLEASGPGVGCDVRSLPVVGLARIGTADQVVYPTRLAALAELEESVLGLPLHSFVLCGSLHECEYEHLELFGPSLKNSA